LQCSHFSVLSFFNPVSLIFLLSLLKLRGGAIALPPAGAPLNKK